MFREFVATNRLVSSRVFGILFILLVAFSSPSWGSDSSIALLSESVGMLLLIIATEPYMKAASICGANEFKASRKTSAIPKVLVTMLFSSSKMGESRLAR